jgi:hypothetical protein
MLRETGKVCARDWRRVALLVVAAEGWLALELELELELAAALALLLGALVAGGRATLAAWLSRRVTVR